MDFVELTSNTGSIKVHIIRKNIKAVHLKVYRDCTAGLSVPNNTPDEWIEEYVVSHKKWVFKQLDKYIKTTGYNNLVDIKNGSSTRFLGKDLRIIIVKDNVNSICREDKKLIIKTKDINNQEKIKKQLDSWWREQAFVLFDKIVDNLMPIFEKHDIKKPEICVKKMKTLWGSCNKEKNRITLNEYLMKADIYCIEYVVLHELSHLVYNAHNEKFYNFLTIYMPDWKDRKIKLDKEVVLGI